MVAIGSDAKREVEDIHLPSHACEQTELGAFLSLVL
jgi:hypothetical protein